MAAVGAAIVIVALAGCSGGDAPPAPEPGPSVSPGAIGDTGCPEGFPEAYATIAGSEDVEVEEIDEATFFGGTAAGIGYGCYLAIRDTEAAVSAAFVPVPTDADDLAAVFELAGYQPAQGPIGSTSFHDPATGSTYVVSMDDQLRESRDVFAAWFATPLAFIVTNLG